MPQPTRRSHSVSQAAIFSAMLPAEPPRGCRALNDGEAARASACGSDGADDGGADRVSCASGVLTDRGADRSSTCTSSVTYSVRGALSLIRSDGGGASKLVAARSRVSGAVSRTMGAGGGGAPGSVAARSPMSGAASRTISAGARRAPGSVAARSRVQVLCRAPRRRESVRVQAAREFRGRSLLSFEAQRLGRGLSLLSFEAQRLARGIHLFHSKRLKAVEHVHAAPAANLAAACLQLGGRYAEERAATGTTREQTHRGGKALFCGRRTTTPTRPRVRPGRNRTAGGRHP